MSSTTTTTTTTTIPSDDTTINNNTDDNDSVPWNKSPPPPSQKKQTLVVQYIVLRRDLDWPPGAMAAQAAHASLAAVAMGLQHHHAPTQAYLSPSQLPHMTKYVYGVDTLADLESVREIWKKEFCDHGGEEEEEQALHHYYSYWWIEQPENIPTAFATWPVQRTNQVSKLIKKMKLTFF
jgi:Peptidyl-tRNA hydrolase PTH2